MVVCLLVSTLNSYGTHAVTLASDLLILEGRIRYLKDWDTEIVAQLNQRKIADASSNVVFQTTPGTQSSHVLRATRVSGGQTRRFDYAAAKRAAPALYATYVTETPPAFPVKLTFKSAGKWAARSKTWDDLRSDGWLRMSEIYGARRAPKPMFFATTAAKDLYDIRQMRAPLDEQRTAMRMELAELLVPSIEEMEAVTYGDGKILPGANPPSRKIDLTLAEQHPTLRRFVKLGTRAESVRWGFVSERELYEEDPEGDQWAD